MTLEIEISGEVLLPWTITLRSALLIVRVLDVSATDAAAVMIGEYRSLISGERVAKIAFPPIAFVAASRTAVSAELRCTSHDRLVAGDFLTVQSMPVPSTGTLTPIQLIMASIE